MASNGKSNTNRYTNLYVKRRLLKLEIDVFGIISNGLFHHTPKQKIMGMIRKELQIISVQVGLDQAEINQLWGQFMGVYQELTHKTVVSLRRVERKFGKKEDYEESLKQRRSIIYNCIRARIMNNELVKRANEMTFQYENRLKREEIFGTGGLLDQDLDNYSPFFLASSHPKPAKDHADWEGKMYYDEDWEKRITPDQEVYARIAAYIKNHKLRSVQWVVGAPVYLVFRPNCKHYLRSIPIEEVLHASAKTLLKRHKMYMPEEKPVSRQILYYRDYYARLKVEEALHELVPNEKLAQDIAKDKKLLAKWTKIINNENDK